MIGKVINDKYHLVEKLGAGGAGDVYKAFHVQLKTWWALKMIPSTEASGEYEIFKLINHPAFPRLVDVIQENDKTALVFDYYEGPTLQEIIDKHEPIEEKQILNWADKILDAIAYLHHFREEPIIYRDLKPSNLIVLPDNSLKLIDFGTARFYKQENKDDTIYLGTPGYAAPEQYGHAQTDVRTDIYNFGMTLFHLSTGKHPLHCSEIRYGDLLIEAGISEKLTTVILKCADRNPEARYNDTAEVKEAMNSIRYGSPIPSAQRARGKNAVEIGVSGIQKGVGATHFCFLFGMWLQKKGYRTAVLEYEENGDTMDLCKMIHKENQVLKSGFFQIQGLSIFPSMGKDKLDRFKRYDFDYLILDYGIYDEYVSVMMRRSDVKLVMAAGADWKVERLRQFLEKNSILLKEQNTFLAFPLQNHKSIQLLKSACKLSHMIPVPYAVNPWKPDSDVKNAMEELFEKLFQPDKKHKNMKMKKGRRKVWLL